MEWNSLTNFHFPFSQIYWGHEALSCYETLPLCESKCHQRPHVSRSSVSHRRAQMCSCGHLCSPKSFLCELMTSPPLSFILFYRFASLTLYCNSRAREKNKKNNDRLSKTFIAAKLWIVSMRQRLISNPDQNLHLSFSYCNSSSITVQPLPSLYLPYISVAERAFPVCFSWSRSVAEEQTGGYYKEFQCFQQNGSVPVRWGMGVGKYQCLTTWECLRSIALTVHLNAHTLACHVFLYLSPCLCLLRSLSSSEVSHPKTQLGIIFIIIISFFYPRFHFYNSWWAVSGGSLWLFM